MTRLFEALMVAATIVALGCGGAQSGATDTTVDPAKANPCVANPCAADPATPATADAKPKAADATILAGDGSHVQLQSAWLNTTAVIVFYRGHWCPFCQRQLTELQANLDKFAALNANLIAVSADPEDIEKMRAKVGATFELYADPDLGAIKAFNVLDEGNGIASPAVFIVDQSGTVHYSYIGENASDRVLINVLLAELAKVQNVRG
ncbi:MAG TPA: peroxiredoxin-like family protein [Kofleriaceae bacterium]|nr:peroxiredoxin-like family protein [Kofleriaceae bacterium]